MTLQSLLERVESASGADRELDAEIWFSLAWEGQGDERDPPALTHSLDATLALVERVLPGWFGIYQSSEYSGGASRGVPTVSGQHRATLVRNPAQRGSPEVTATAPTPALALLAAMLRAKIGEDQ